MLALSRDRHLTIHTNNPQRAPTRDRQIGACPSRLVRLGIALVGPAPQSNGGRPTMPTHALTRCELLSADFARVLSLQSGDGRSVIGDLLIGTWGAGLGVHTVLVCDGVPGLAGAGEGAGLHCMILCLPPRERGRRLPITPRRAKRRRDENEASNPRRTRRNSQTHRKAGSLPETMQTTAAGKQRLIA